MAYISLFVYHFLYYVNKLKLKLKNLEHGLPNNRSKGRTPPIRAPIGFYAKVRILKARFEREAAIF